MRQNGVHRWKLQVMVTGNHAGVLGTLRVGNRATLRINVTTRRGCGGERWYDAMPGWGQGTWRMRRRQSRYSSVRRTRG